MTRRDFALSGKGLATICNYKDSLIKQKVVKCTGKFLCRPQEIIMEKQVCCVYLFCGITKISFRAKGCEIYEKTLRN